MEPKIVSEVAKLVVLIVAAAVVSYAIGIHVTRWLILSLTETKGDN